VARRIFHAPAVVRALVTEGHYNHSLGEYVTSSADFRDKLARKSDQMSERLGWDQHLVPVNPQEIAPAAAAETVRKRQLRRGADPKVFA